jgi:glutamate-1-semialdehyde 2,1-aminomutase
MEPIRGDPPREDFLPQIAAACRAAGAVLVIDEVTSGWRGGFPGASPRLGLQPDLAVYAKAMSNGIPCAAVVGTDAVMNAATGSFISSSYWTDGIGPAATLACIGKMQALDVQPRVWQLGEHLQGRLRELAAQHPQLGLRVAGLPCAPSIAFGLGEQSAAAKAICIRQMLGRGFLFSTQLYVMWPHTEGMIGTFIAGLDESLGEVTRLHEEGRLAAEAGPLPAAAGFARLV